MRKGRGIWGDLRDALEEGVDDLEREGARQIDRLAELGVEGLEQLRSEVAPTSREDSRARSRASRRDTESRRRARRRAEKAARAEREAEKRARRAARYAEKAERRVAKRKSRKQRERALTPEERAHRARVRQARRRANQRIGFLTHAGSYVATLALLMVTTRSIRVVAIVALGWGIGVFCHYLWALAAPKLRDKWVEEEVGERSERGVRHERREVGSRSRKSMEDLSASIAHEIRNPITAAKSLVQQMGEDPRSEENLEYAGLALSELDRVERSISHLLRYARDEEPRFAEMSLYEVASAAVAGLRERAEALGIDLVVEFDGAGEMRGDAEKLRRVVENLLANAIDALAEAGTPMAKVELLGGQNLAATELWLRVIDNGPGIPDAERERIWSPFFTTKDAGTGLGLALSRKTVEAHGGRIELLTDARQGSEFVLTFPRDPAPVAMEVAGDGVD